MTAPARFSHDHVFLGTSHDANTRRTLWVVGLTAVMMVGEIAAGYITGSMALLADGYHMATHAGALSVAAGAYVFAKRHANNRRFSFGTGKVGDLAGFASALVLGLIALGIGAESVRRLLEPIAVDFGTATLVAVLGLAVNLISAFLLGGGQGHGHAHHHDDDHGHGHAHDNNLRAAYLHVLADALTSVLAIVALLAGQHLGWVWMDPLMGIIGAIVIARWSWGLIRTTAAVLLDTTDDHVSGEVRELVAEIEGVRLTDLHVWRIGPQAHAAIVEVEGGISPEVLRKRLHSVHEIAHLTVAVRL